MSKEWFAYDPVDGASFFATEAEAKKQAEDWLDEERNKSADGWSEDVEGICWGRVCGGVVQTKNEPAPEGSDFDYIADYALRDAPAEAARVTPAVEDHGVIVSRSSAHFNVLVGGPSGIVHSIHESRLPGATVGDAVTVTVRKG